MIATHHAPHCSPPWIAVDMDAAAELLDGYGLTEKEKTELPELMAGYCRLIDEDGLCFYGETEEEAVSACKANKNEKTMTEDLLFSDLPESLSPYEDFKRRHHISTEREFTRDPDHPWTARIRSHDYAASGVTERDAVYNLAYNHSLSGWESVNW